MISRSAEKIKRLSKLGFHYREISRPYIVLLGMLMFGVTALSLVVTSILTNQFSKMAGEWNLQISTSLHAMIYGTALGLVCVIFVANLVSILVSTNKLCK